MTNNGRTDRPGYHYIRDYWRPSMLYLAQMLVTHWDCRIIARTNGGDYIVSHRPDPYHKPGWYVWWVLCDNGGEINVVKVNDDNTLRSIPYAQSNRWPGYLVPMGRLAFWCSEVMRGEVRRDFRDDDPSVDDLTVEDAIVDEHAEWRERNGRAAPKEQQDGRG